MQSRSIILKSVLISLIKNPRIMEPPSSFIKLPIFVDCLEFCPSQNHPDFLACGLYQLKDDQNQYRIGGIEILCLDHSDTGIGFKNHASYRTDTAGVLGLRWIKDDQLICACSDGQIRILNLKTGNLAIDTTLMIGKDNIILTVETDPGLSTWISGDSQGQACIGSLDTKQFNSWPAHENCEIWCANFHKQDENLLFSGADDCVLKSWDRRMISDSAKSIHTFRHDAGVTAVHSTENSDRIWSGSYDDRLRLWDLRWTKSPIRSLNLGGGVWRIRQNGQYLLCACMYNGWCVVHSDAGHNISIKYADNSNGASLLYGIDWMPIKYGGIVCGTFYDYTVRAYDIGKYLG